MSETVAESNLSDEELFGGPGRGGDYPRMIDLKGRLLLITPTVLDKGLPDKFDPDGVKKVDRITANIVVLDGGTLYYGGRPEDEDDPIPHDREAELPFLIEDMYISGRALIGQLRSRVGKGRVLARLGKGEATKPGQKRPWILSEFDELTDAEKQLARDYLNRQNPFE